MATRAPLSEAEKTYISTRKLAGTPLGVIASELRCAYETTRKWWRCQQQGRPPRPRGRPPHGILSTYPPAVAEQAVIIKRAHPHWGPANVTLELQQQLGLPSETLPSQARLAALFKTVCPEAVQPRQRQLYPAQAPAKARRPHQRWQVAGKEKVPLGEHDVATILNIRDPASAVMLGSRAIVTTTAKGWRKLTLAEVQDTLRTAFMEWGLPLEIQTDHEVVYTGSPAADFPSLFTLWVVGLGMSHMPSRDRRPTDQPQIERNHRTLGDMTWKDEAFAQVERLQTRLDERRQRYNYQLPVQAADCDGQPPLVAHPTAQHSGRPFHRDLEWMLFELQRVDVYLASRLWTRQVSESGNVSLGNHLYALGRAYAQQTVSVCFVPTTRTFRFQSMNGTPLKELPAIGLDKADLIGYLPMTEVSPVAFQLPLPLEGV